MIQSIRGMNDLLAPEIVDWQYVETILRRVIASYGYQEIRFPIVEKTALFKRSIGEVTDIVEKEMYTFTDRNGDSLTLRPEGTAGCVRACLQQGLLQRATPRLWYLGPMFRRERPQKGRCRQFHHLGVEAFGMPGPDIDAELILSTARFWQQLGLTEQVNLELNSLGNTADRQRYRDELVAYFERYQHDLDEDSQRRLHTNPLRILDSKNPAMCDLIQDAPKLLDCIGAQEKEHFAQLRAYLDAAGVRYTINPVLVRGLDYYSHTVFEWRTTSLGAQDTVCAGGRYDSLIEQLGGKPNFAVGYAVGIERLILLYQQHVTQEVATDDQSIYLLLVGAGAQQQGLKLAEHVRDAFPRVTIISHCGDGSFKSQFKKADKSHAKIALILGERELAEQTIGVKLLREEDDQVTIPQDELINYLISVLDY